MDKDGPARHFEVDDPVEAFHKMESLARRVLKVPKKRIDAMAEKAKRSRKSKRK